MKTFRLDSLRDGQWIVAKTIKAHTRQEAVLMMEYNLAPGTAKLHGQKSGKWRLREIKKKEKKGDDKVSTDGRGGQ